MKKAIALFVLGMLVFTLSAVAEEVEESEAAEEAEVTREFSKLVVAPGDTLTMTLTPPEGALDWSFKMPIPRGWSVEGHEGKQLEYVHEGDPVTEVVYTLNAPERKGRYSFSGRWKIGDEGEAFDRARITVTDAASTEEGPEGEGTEEEENEEEETEEENSKPERPVRFQKRFDSGVFHFFDVLFEVKVQARHLFRTYKDRISGVTFFRVRGDDIDCRLNRFRLSGDDGLVTAEGVSVAGTGMLTCTMPVDITVEGDVVTGMHGDTTVFNLDMSEPADEEPDGEETEETEDTEETEEETEEP
jgi:hypothetical protein